jgi:fructose-specific phosphotransferase system component IIB
MDILYIIRDVSVKWTTFFEIIRLFNMTTSEAMAKTRQVLEERYANYWSLAPNERMLLAASVLADDFRVSEKRVRIIMASG